MSLLDLVTSPLMNDLSNPKNVTFNLRDSFVLEAYENLALLHIKSISSTATVRVMYLCLSHQKNILSQLLECSKSYASKQYASNEPLIYPACFIPYIDLGSLQICSGFAIFSGKAVSCSINTSKPMCLNKWALAAFFSSTINLWDTACARRMRIDSWHALGAYVP